MVVVWERREFVQLHTYALVIVHENAQLCAEFGDSTIQSNPILHVQNSTAFGSSAMSSMQCTFSER